MTLSEGIVLSLLLFSLLLIGLRGPSSDRISIYATPDLNYDVCSISFMGFLIGESNFFMKVKSLFKFKLVISNLIVI